MPRGEPREPPLVVASMMLNVTRRFVPLALLTTLGIAGLGCAPGLQVGPVTDEAPERSDSEVSTLVLLPIEQAEVARWTTTGEADDERSALRIGTFGASPRSAVTADTSRAYLRFDLDPLPSAARIEEATLVLVPVGPPRPWKDWEVEVRPTRNPVPTGLAWATQPAVSSLTAPGVLTAESRIHADVTEVVRAWVKGTPNHGLQLRGRPESAPHNVEVYRYDAEHIAQRPRLVIRYVK